MPERYHRLVSARGQRESPLEMSAVDRLAAELAARLERRSAAIDAAHVHGASSSAIQALVSQILTGDLRFSEEVVLTAQEGFVTQARPDFIHRLGDGRGILAEVERGGTVTNNHDLKDFWKTHVALDAHHLFLVVPMANWNEAGKVRETPFVRVVNRLSAFFGDQRREVDVLSCHVFGYGRTSPLP